MTFKVLFKLFRDNQNTPNHAVMDQVVNFSDGLKKGTEWVNSVEIESFSCSHSNKYSDVTNVKKALDA